MEAENIGKTVHRNGKVELLRFIFCISVLLFHCEKYVLGEPALDKGIRWSLFCHGSMGVEFFFILSGVLMAKSAYKNWKSEQTISLEQECSFFLKHKLLAIFPYHVLAFVFTFVAYVISNKMGLIQTIESAVESIPSFFLIQMTGINLCSPNHVTWYISCMLIAMALLYPLCRRYYQMFTHYIAPIMALLILGYCIKETGRLTGVGAWTGVCYKSVLRAISEIALGAFAYEIAKKIKERTYTSVERSLLTITEFLLFVFIMIYMIGTFPSEWEVIELFAMVVFVILAFSGIGLRSEAFDNKLSYHLGKLSLPLYLVQLIPIYMITQFAKKWSYKMQITGIVIITFLFAYLLMGIVEIWQRKKGKNRL